MAHPSRQPASQHQPSQPACAGQRVCSESAAGGRERCGCSGVSVGVALGECIHTCDILYIPSSPLTCARADPTFRPRWPVAGGLSGLWPRWCVPRRVLSTVQGKGQAGSAVKPRRAPERRKEARAPERSFASHLHTKWSPLSARRRLLLSTTTTTTTTTSSCPRVNSQHSTHTTTHHSSTSPTHQPAIHPLAPTHLPTSIHLQHLPEPLRYIPSPPSHRHLSVNTHCSPSPG